MYRSTRSFDHVAKPSTNSTQSGTSGTALIALLMVAILIPAQPEIGGLRIDPYRMFALIMTVPFFLRIITARDNSLNMSDWLMVVLALWIVLTFFINHGSERLPYAVIAALELVGGYIAGRALIRNPNQYRALFRYMAVGLLVLLPFAIFEMLTSRILIAELISPFFQVYQNFADERFGFSRAQTVFPHPILFGLFCSIAIANFYYLSRGRQIGSLARLGLGVGMTFTSLSSAPLLSALLQLALIAWHRVIGPKWKLLVGIAIFTYLFLEIFSNRGPIILLIEYLTLNPRTAWWRVHIWNYGIDNVLANPIFGIALHDWVRPAWLAPTIDNFWLVIAMRHGIPGVTLLILSIGLHMYRIAGARLESSEIRDMRTGYMITLTGILFTLCTVHIWSSTAFFVMFYVGAGSFLFRNETMAQPPKDDAPPSSDESRSASKHTRFPAGPRIGGEKYNRNRWLARDHSRKKN